ncbi:MAG: extracellular solute-binding protein [Deltaproteobacteria bacterium]|nr:extracellular solute-binding protein [Deltaproteobacteria bacterium]
MKVEFLVKPAAAVVLIWLLGVSFSAHGAVANPTLLRAKEEAETKGFIFETSRDEIVAKAKKEEKVRVLSALEPEIFKPMIESFKKKYPFIDVQIQEITGTEDTQRLLLELNAGSVKDWDVVHAPDDFYSELAGHARRFDILGMAEQKVLTVNPKMVDPNLRAVVSIASSVGVVAYNKKRIGAEQVPNSLGDFLKPEFRGRKFLVDIRPHWMVALMPGLGQEWVLDYARRIKEQQPVWIRGQTRGLVSIANGEYAMDHLVNYHSCVRALRKNPTQSLACKVIEPVPVRFQESGLVIKVAPHPYAALLFLEHEVSPEGQKVIDEYGPLKSHLHAGGEINKIIQGKKTSINDYRTYHNSTKWIKMVLEAYGFPREETK